MAVQPSPEVEPSGPTPLDPNVDGVQPYVSDQTVMPELTWSAVLLGAILGIVFGAFVAVPGVAGRHDGFGVDSGGGTLDHAVSRVLQMVRNETGDDS